MRGIGLRAKEGVDGTLSSAAVRYQQTGGGWRQTQVVPRKRVDHTTPSSSRRRVIPLFRRQRDRIENVAATGSPRSSRAMTAQFWSGAAAEKNTIPTSANARATACDESREKLSAKPLSARWAPSPVTCGVEPFHVVDSWARSARRSRAVDHRAGASDRARGG